MSAGPGFAAALRNFSTLFLLCFVLFAPLHLAVAWHWQKAVTVAPALESGDVEVEVAAPTTDPGHVSAYRRAKLALCLVEILMLPFLAAGARRVFEREATGEVPTVPDALAHARGHLARMGSGTSWSSVAWGAIVAVALLASLSVVAARTLDMVFGAAPLWPVVAVVGAATRSASVPFLLGPAASGSPRQPAG